MQAGRVAARVCVLLAACIAPGLSLTLPSGQAVQVSGPAPDVGAFKRAGCDNFTGHEWQPLRPAFHITVPYGWMNDPHGMFEREGRVHVFFQYNPRALAWGAPFWGHVVSTDLAHWTWLPPALAPDTAYDWNGVWSGAATVTDNGTPILTFTAASTFAPEFGNYVQRQAMAVPVDMNKDPLLKQWAKPDTNPFLVQVPPGGSSFQFRDPTEARHAVWRALTSKDNPKPLNASHYALAIGVQAYCMGGAGIYSAPHMSGPWSYQGSLYNQMVPEPQVNGQCMAARTSSPAAWPGAAYGGPCDQFGAHCRMWEVVDMAELENGVFYLKWDDQSRFRDLFSMEWYVLGNGAWDYSAIHPELPAKADKGSQQAAAKGSSSSSSSSSSASRTFGKQYSGYPNTASLGWSKAANASPSQAGSSGDFNNVDNLEESATRTLFRGQIDGQRFAPQRTDFGSVYASMVFRTADMRQVQFSWIYETAAGCRDMCSDDTPGVVAAQGFKGAQTLPRQLTYEPLTKTLRAYPVGETEKLRGKQTFNATNAAVASFPAVSQLLPVTKVPPAAAGSKRSAAAITARQFEVQAAFTLLPPGRGGTRSGVTAEAGGGRRDSSSGSIVTQADEFAAGVRIELGSGRFADVFIKGTVTSLAPASPRYAISSLAIWVDRANAGGATNTSFMEGGPVPTPVDSSQAWLAPDQPLNLSVWVDHGVIEAFAMRGLGRVTSRIYPAGDDVAWGVSAWVVPPAPTGAGGGLQDVDRAAAALTAESIKQPTTVTGLYCWWCRLWSGAACGDRRCFSAFEKWPQPGSWGMLMDAQVWEVKSAWLAPSC